MPSTTTTTPAAAAVLHQFHLPHIAPSAEFHYSTKSTKKRPSAVLKQKRQEQIHFSHSHPHAHAHPLAYQPYMLPTTIQTPQKRLSFTPPSSPAQLPYTAFMTKHHTRYPFAESAGITDKLIGDAAIFSSKVDLTETVLVREVEHRKFAESVSLLLEAADSCSLDSHSRSCSSFGNDDDDDLVADDDLKDLDRLSLSKSDLDGFFENGDDETALKVPPCTPSRPSGDFFEGPRAGVRMALFLEEVKEKLGGL
jgi:hypothetical protein